MKKAIVILSSLVIIEFIIIVMSFIPDNRVLQNTSFNHNKYNNFSLQ